VRRDARSAAYGLSAFNSPTADRYAFTPRLDGSGVLDGEFLSPGESAVGYEWVMLIDTGEFVPRYGSRWWDFDPAAPDDDDDFVPGPDYKDGAASLSERIDVDHPDIEHPDGDSCPRAFLAWWHRTGRELVQRAEEVIDMT